MAGEQQTQILEAVRALRHHEYRIQVLATCLPRVIDQTSLLKWIRLELADWILTTANQPRSQVLKICATKEFYTPSILSPQTIHAVAEHIVEICQEWVWL